MWPEGTAALGTSASASSQRQPVVCHVSDCHRPIPAMDGQDRPLARSPNAVHVRAMPSRFISQREEPMNDKANTAAPLPECFHTAAGETIEITQTDHGQYCVDCWDANGEGRWNRKFDKRSDALVEFERWRYLQALTDGTP